MGAFSIFKDKRKKGKPQTPTAKAYYTRLANRAKIAMFTVIILLVAFCLFSYSFYPDELKIENLRYLLYFVSFNQTDEVQVGSTVTFDSDPTNRYALVRGNIAVLSNSKLMVYDTSGRILQNVSVKSENPMLVPAGKNMIVYDLGGKRLDIYNSFASVYGEDFSYPILGVSASDNGSYAVLSGAKNYRSAFYVYDANYRLIYTHKFPTEYSTAIALNGNGNRVLVLSHISESGDYLGSASIFDMNETEPLVNFRYVGELPLSCSFTDDGGYRILTDTAIRFYNRNNELIKTVNLPYGLLNCVYGDKYVMLTFDTAGLAEQKRVVVYNENGAAVYDKSVNTAPDDVLMHKNRLYLLSEGNLLVYDLAGQNELYNIITENDAVEMIISENRLLVFTYSGVTVYSTDSMTETDINPETSQTEVS